MGAEHPTCGNCGGAVNAADVACPHCGVLLAAYASPVGSQNAQAPAVLAGIDADIPAPTPVDIPAHVPEPGEHIAPIPTAPKPLFDLDVSVQKLAEAAESDHETDVVTIADPDVITTATPQFATPDYALPPDDRPSDDDDPPPPASPATPPESPTVHNAPLEDPREIAEPTTPPATDPASTPADTGITEDYLRSLHRRTGYSPADGQTSRSMRVDRIVERDTRTHDSGALPQPPQLENLRRITYLIGGLVVTVVVLWLVVAIQMASGRFSGGLIMLTVLATVALTRWQAIARALNLHD